MSVQNSNANSSVIGSFLNSVISSAPTKSTASCPVILPYVNCLPVGSYESKIVEITDAVQNGVLVGIDCTHELIDSNGKVYCVKFRFFAPEDIQHLKATLRSYNLSGTLGSALMGLTESVDIAPRPGSAKYVWIANRSLRVTTSTNTQSLPTPTSSASSSPHRKGISLSNRAKLGGGKSLSKRN